MKKDAAQGQYLKNAHSESVIYSAVVIYLIMSFGEQLLKEHNLDR